jgi:VIT1/CCC1 family predicted Fe2+/Mn2+ transporter
MPRNIHPELHRLDRIGWLHAAVLGANDGIVSARLGGAPVFKAAARVAFWGALAMGITAAVGALFGVAV